MRIEARIFDLPKTILYVTHVYDQRLLDKVDQEIDF